MKLGFVFNMVRTSAQGGSKNVFEKSSDLGRRVSVTTDVDAAKVAGCVGSGGTHRI
jgi:hypothetical protein